MILFFVLSLQQNRKLELLTIDRVPKPSRVDTKNFIRVIIVLARSHPGESVTSFVCQGLLEFLLGTHPIAIVLRENFVFKIVPMVNPDGVFLGNNRCNLIGQDLNRCWNVATEFSHPTILAMKNLLKDIDSSDVSAIRDFKFCFRAIRFIQFIFSVIKLTLCWIYTRTPVQMVHLYTAIHTKTFIGTNVIWCFRNCWPRILLTLLPKMSCSTPMSEKVDRHVASAANVCPIRSIRTHLRCLCADFS